MEKKDSACKVMLLPGVAEQMLKRTIISVRPYSRKELTALYGVSCRTLRNWLNPLKKELGERKGHMYSVKQIEIIFDVLGVPYTYEVVSSLNVA